MTLLALEKSYYRVCSLYIKGYRYDGYRTTIVMTDLYFHLQVTGSMTQATIYIWH